MLSREDNELPVRVGPATPMGRLMFPRGGLVTDTPAASGSEVERR